MNPVEVLHHRILDCRLCEDAGYIERAMPVVSDSLGGRMMLIGQAPGEVELTVRRPFKGKAGKELFRWMRSIGVEEDEFRARVYITSITRCFPGKASGGAGDRRPSQKEIALCRPWLEQQLTLVQPEVILLVGGLAIERFLLRQPLADLIGRRFEQDGRIFIPLPHPSGASRWLNRAEHRELLQQALGLVCQEWDRLNA